MKVKFKEVQAVALSVYPGEGGTTQVLEVRGHLTPSNAGKLGVKEGSFTDEGIPRKYEKFPESCLSIDGADITMGDREFRSSLIHKFAVKVPKAKSQQGVALEVGFRIHFGGKEPIKPWLDRQNKDPFMINISARQEDLRFGDEDAEDEEVEASGGADEPEESAEPQCISCANDNPMGLGGFHINGQRCTNATQAPEQDPENSGPTLAPAVLVGCSHQKGTRGRRPRDRAQEAIADGTAPLPEEVVQ